MKKIIFGAVLFIGGLLSTLELITISISKRDYFAISYLKDFEVFSLFLISLLSILIGLTICIFEAYGEEIKKKFN